LLSEDNNDDIRLAFSEAHRPFCIVSMYYIRILQTLNLFNTILSGMTHAQRDLNYWKQTIWLKELT